MNGPTHPVTHNINTSKYKKTIMKQTILGLITLATITLGSNATINAQEDSRQDRFAVMQTRQKERLVKSLNLTDEQKAKFEEAYTRYQGELNALRPQRSEADAQTGATPQDSQSGDKAKKKERKELSDAEATTQLQAHFDRQAEQIQRQQARLDIQKKYCAEMSAFLTPQQLLKVFSQPEGGNRGQQAGRGRQGGRGGFGGGPRGGFDGGPRGGFGGGMGGPGGDF